MTRPMAIEHREDGDAVEGGRNEGVAGDDVAAPQLTAIQHRYEEAKACIVDPARSSSYETHPATEAIDVHAVMPPVPPTPTPSTETMSTAARCLAQELVIEESPWPAGASRSRPEPGAASRWWRAVRAALQGAAPVHR